MAFKYFERKKNQNQNWKKKVKWKFETFYLKSNSLFWSSNFNFDLQNISEDIRAFELI